MFNFVRIQYYIFSKPQILVFISLWSGKKNIPSRCYPYSVPRGQFVYGVKMGGIKINLYYLKVP